MNKIRILLAEDDNNLGLLLRNYLNAKNYETELFVNGISCPGGLPYRVFQFVHTRYNDARDGWAYSCQGNSLQKMQKCLLYSLLQKIRKRISSKGLNRGPMIILQNHFQ